MATTAQKEALASNVTWCCEIWKMVARDGATLAVASHTRNIVVGGVTYEAGPFEPESTEAQIGLEPDDSTLKGVLDSVVTEADILSGRWKGARIYKAIVIDYRDPSVGVVAERNGFAGPFSIRNGTFTVEFQSLSQALHQMAGEVTSPTDRRRRLDELGINIAAFTHAVTVNGVTDRRRFTVDWTPANSYLRYGLAQWSNGGNSGLEMEIKDNVGAAIELALPMRSDIQIGDNVVLIRGYDGSRETAKLLGAAVVESMEAEPDSPSMEEVYNYPES